MPEEKTYRLAKVAGELGVGVHTIVEHLQKKGINLEDTKPTSKLDQASYEILLQDFQSDKKAKDQSKNIEIQMKRDREHIVENVPAKPKNQPEDVEEDTLLVKDLGSVSKVVPEEPPVEEIPVVEEKKKVEGLKVVGKIDLAPKKEKSKAKEKKETESLPSAEQDETKDPGESIVAKDETITVENKPDETELIKSDASKETEVDAPSDTSAETKDQTKDKTESEDTQKSEEKDEEEEDDQVIRANAPKLKGLSVMGKIKIPAPIVRKKVVNEDADKKKRKRKHTPEKIDTKALGSQFSKRNEVKEDDRKSKTGFKKDEISDKDVQKQMKQTFAKIGNQNLSGKGGKSRQKARKERKDRYLANQEERVIQREIESKQIHVTEFVTANELASMMDIKVNEIITVCFSLGIMISINQRLDAEIITLLAENFGYEVVFVDAAEQDDIEEEEDDPKDLVERPPIVTIMGHVDHGKTSLLDYIRDTNVIAGEAGGITQHVAAYEVTLENKKKITFIDTPGHEAFTAMRARGAKVTDIVIIVIAADDSVMPQTKEAIAHAQAAGVPIVFAYNKIDKDGANADRIREQLSSMNILVEEWGGKYQSQEISAKKGLNIEKLLDKVLLEAEILELKANPNKRAKGTVMETHIDKGKGVVSSILVQEGTIKVGDFVLAGSHYGRVRALFNEREQRIEKAGPSTPVSVLGFQGAPTAGDLFTVFEDENSAKEIANRRTQLQREQGIRASKHITLEEIGRRLAVGSFKELKLIVKGDVDGSVEALSDSLLKLSKEEVQVNVIHKGVGQITESDVLLATASDAIILGFNVRPAQSAKKLAEDESIEIKTYSVIYHAIEEIKSAIEGLLDPEYKEEVTSTIEVREVFKITKVGTIAGCYVLTGKVERNNKLRIIRDGVVIHDGEIETLKRFKDDAKEVLKGFECGIQVKNYNDVKIGDNFETYKEVEVKRKTK
ncbi:MAG: translation initiation factor IF-2 [Flavobacteriales bacterium]|nr:translation initiation factor IF-2 [Flavobacteriales bacterium]